MPTAEELPHLHIRAALGSVQAISHSTLTALSDLRLVAVDEKTWIHICFALTWRARFPSGSAGKESPCNAGDLGSIPGLGRSPGERSSYSLQCPGLENSMDCIVHGGAESQTRLSGFYFDFTVIQPVSEQLPLQKHTITPGGEEGENVPVGMASIKQTEISKAGEDVEKVESLCPVGGDGKWCSSTQHGKSLKNCTKMYHTEIPLLGMYQETQKLGLERYLHTDIQGTVIHTGNTPTVG